MRGFSKQNKRFWYTKILNSPENEPEFFIGLAHKHYDGKEII